MSARLAQTLLAAATSGLFLFSCAPPQKPGFSPDTTQAQRRVAGDDFQGALDSFAALAESYPDDKAVRKKYAAAVEKTKARADEWFEEKDFDAAEKAYSLILANFHRFGAFEKSLPFGPELLSRRVLQCQEHLSERRARQALSAGEYLKALDGFKVLPLETLRDLGLSSGLRRIMEEIKGLADKALARKDFVAAGKGYAVLWQGYPLAQEIGLSLAFSRSDPEGGMNNCRTQLIREGLDQYRKGNLKEAIAIWQGLLQFDPENAEIRRAVETATEQLKKLRDR